MRREPLSPRRTRARRRRDGNELLEHCRERLAGFKRPKRMVIGELPKTSTGKIRKNELRDQARLVS